MNRENAIAQATETARVGRVRMVVTFNPYDEEPDELERFGFYPEAAVKLFPHEEIVETINAGGATVVGAVYLTDNGACYCGEHLGMTAKASGRDRSGQEIYRLTAADAATDPAIACETCGRRP